ncbi:hypothetical protein [Hydrogenophaga electricum]|uniref:Lipoprotein n=1 Tax=Hydrogenophaga electricum TaxID=1230953 RepID=A0ABQ6C665_9BURK|nr:hypothetical protein [Hydrogenophaga electricum]GLS15736.1 hypothetical protein GCM10007935_31730 [Hydrogenophaga electricum]
MQKLFLITSLTLMGLLSACGGGGENAGDATEFSVNPKEVDWSSLQTECDKGSGGRALQATSVHVINGGVPPFRVISNFPGSIYVDGASAKELSGKNPRFEISTYVSHCKASYSVTVLDYHSQMVSVEIKVDPQE